MAEADPPRSAEIVALGMVVKSLLVALSAPKARAPSTFMREMTETTEAADGQGLAGALPLGRSEPGDAEVAAAVEWWRRVEPNFRQMLDE